MLDSRLRHALMQCPACATELPDRSRFCLACGTALEGSATATLLHGPSPTPAAPAEPEGSGAADRPGAPEARAAAARPVAAEGRAAKRQSGGGSPSLPSLDQARFVPGAILAGRYRIAGRLGRGGMGEVYRADDLKLDQPVALKFLPGRLASDGAALARFHREVVIARQVSHPNVCRVFDIGETAGLHYLSMEYIDGEDLDSLLRRIGRLPPDKAIELARQLCAGLAAAHASGILHRDLKPANVMVDGRGRARVTDFGLAGLGGQFDGDEVFAGTPAYMAPERLAGEEASAASDIYALGLVLYELFTGKRAFPSDSDPKRLTAPRPPSAFLRDLDPMVERVILRCLEADPARRPASAMQVAAALPGGDLLQAALAAGETPSPEMVAAAAAPGQGTLTGATAAAYLAVFLIGIVVVVILAGRAELHRLVPLKDAPAVLADRAVTIVKRFGYTEAPVDEAYGFNRNSNYLRYVEEHDKSIGRWDKLSAARPWGMTFWHRQSPRHLEPGAFWNISFNEPPFAESGMANVLLDTRGRLIDFYYFPEALEGAPAAAAAVDWAAVFAMAELDPADFTPVESKWVPPTAYDQRAAWQGVFSEQPEIPLHIEAAAYRGRAVYVEMFGPWTRPARLGPPESGLRERAFRVLLLVIMAASLVGGVLLARRSLRLGRGDRKGAFRLAVYVFVVSMLGWLCAAKHVPTVSPVVNFAPVAWTAPVAWSLYTAATLWLFYIALEPYLRQRWPYRIISWSRLLAGGWRDPLVGRDLLIGALFGIGNILSAYLGVLAPAWLGWRSGPPRTINLDTLIGVRPLLGQLCELQAQSLIAGLGTMILVMLVYMGVRRQWAAVIVVWLFLNSIFVLGSGAVSLSEWLFSGLGLALFMMALMRFGLLAAIATSAFSGAANYPLTLDFSIWYAGSGQFALLVMAGLAIYGFYLCVAGKPPLREGFA